MAQSIGDVLLRRTRLALLDARALVGARDDPVRRVADVLGHELGWDEVHTLAAIEDYAREAHAEGLVPAPAG